MCGCVLSSAAVIAVAAGIGVAVAAAGIGAAGVRAAAVTAGIAAATARVGATAGITAVIAAAFFPTACGAVCVTETAAGAGLCGRREQIQRERYPVEVAARIYISVCGNAARFGYAVAKAVYQHIYGTEHFDNSEQTDRHIDSDGCAHRCVSAVVATTTSTAAIAAASTAAVVAASGIFQLRSQADSFPFCRYKGAALGVAAAIVQVCCCCYIRLCGTKQSHFQVIGIAAVDAADRAAVGPAEFQSIIKDIAQFHVPAAFLETVGAFSQNVDSAQNRIVHGYAGGVDRGNNNIAVTEHIAAVGTVVASDSGGSQNIAGQAFLYTALVKDLLGNDAGFASFLSAATATVSCLQIGFVFKFKSSHRIASFKNGFYSST